MTDRLVKARSFGPQSVEEARERAPIRLALDAAVLLEDALRAKGWTQKNLADELGKSEAYVSQLLSGKTNMTLRTMADVAFVLDTFVRLQAKPTVRAYAFDSSHTMCEVDQAGFWETLEDIEESVHYVTEPAA